MRNIEDQFLLDSTKALIAKTFVSMVLRTSLESVCIGDLCRESHISRRTFYYHFRDKYDVMLWKLHADWYQSLMHHVQDDDVTRCIYGLQEVFMDHRAYYRKLLLYQGQDSLPMQLSRISLCYKIHAIRDDFPELEITDEYLAQLNYDANGAVMSVINWIISNNNLTASQLADILYHNLDNTQRMLDIHNHFLNHMKNHTSQKMISYIDD